MWLPHHILIHYKLSLPADSPPDCPPASSLPHNKGAQLGPVSPQNLTEYPYRSVGKLFWFKPNERGIFEYATAFYSDDNTVMSVAHIFDNNLPPQEAIFIPAMINKYDIYGKNYGYYRIDTTSATFVRKHPDYIKQSKGKKLTTPEFDLCIFKIASGKVLTSKYRSKAMTKAFHKKFKDKDLSFENTAIDQEWKPIKPALFLRGMKETWTLLGYANVDEIWTANGGEMWTVHGFCTHVISDEVEISDTAELITINGRLVIQPAVRRGMSGGPWFLGTDIKSNPKAAAGGCQSGIDEGRNLSYSPLFTKEVLTLVTKREHPVLFFQLVKALKSGFAQQLEYSESYRVLGPVTLSFVRRFEMY